MDGCVLEDATLHSCQAGKFHKSLIQPAGGRDSKRQHKLAGKININKALLFGDSTYFFNCLFTLWVI